MTILTAQEAWQSFISRKHAFVLADYPWIPSFDALREHVRAVVFGRAT